MTVHEEATFWPNVEFCSAVMLPRPVCAREIVGGSNSCVDTHVMFFLTVRQVRDAHVLLDSKIEYPALVRRIVNGLVCGVAPVAPCARI